MQIPIGISQGIVGGGHWGYGSPVSLDSQTHTAINGATGTGKTSLLLSIALAHIAEGHGLAVIDPHGDLVDRIACLIPRNRIRDTIWFDPLAPRVIGLNPLHGSNKPLRLEQAVNIVSSIWSDAWGPQSDFIARNVGLAVIEAVPRPTLLHLAKFFYSEKYADSLFRKVKSENLRSFYQKYREDWDKRQREQAAAPPTNKLDSFLKPAIKLVVGQETGLDIRSVMDSSKILLCRFDKGALGPDAGSFLSSILVSMILFSALERSQVRERPYFGVIIDEFHTFTRGNAPDHLLAETRKYNVFLTIADQIAFERQVYGNVGSLITGRMGAEDAEELARELGVENPGLIIGLQNHHWLVKRAGHDTQHVTGLAPQPITTSSASVIRWSLGNYGLPADEVDRKINLFLSH